MSTNSHHWLAEWFIPHSIIDDVMDKKEKEMKKQDDLKSTWEIEEKETKTEKTENVEVVKELTEEELFYQTYSELDNDSFKNYIVNNPEIIENGYFNILIEDLDNELGIVDTNGNSLLVLDAKNNTMILGVSGEGFVGKLAIIKNIEQVTLKKSETLGDRGETAKQYSDKYDAELVVNASGFKDVGGHGSGGQVNGALIIDGVEYGKPSSRYFIFAFILFFFLL
jgi:exopolysaccharide biosynthesis protein